MTSQGVESKRAATLNGIPSIRTAVDPLIHNSYGFPNCIAYLKDMEIASPYLIAASPDVMTARDNWISKVEDTLDSEYESRLAALPRKNGAIPPSDYRDFVKGMNAFVEKTVRARLPELDSNIQSAIEENVPHEPGTFVRWVMPLLAVFTLGAGAAFYVKGVGKERSAELAVDTREHKAIGYLFIAPWLLGLACFTVGPIIAALAISFTNWNMISPPHWIGFQTYAGLLSDGKFLIGVKNTFMYAVLVIPISLFGGLFTAGLQTMRIRGTDLFKGIIYFPALFTGAETAVLWVNMLNKDHGILNYVLSWFHIRAVDWTDAAHAFTSVVMMNVFWIGGATIVYYAGMKQIPASLYEAADLDGAGLTRKFLKITIPMLSPVILFMVVMTTIGSFQVFTPALFFASDSTAIGSPNDALRFYSVNIYDQAFNQLRMGAACSYAIVLFGIIFTITYAQLRLARRFVHSGGSRMKRLRTLPIYFALLAVCTLFLFPFYWVVISSLKSVAGMDLEPPSMLPAEHLTVDLRAGTKQNVFSADGNQWLNLARSPDLLDANETGRAGQDAIPSPKPLSTASKIPPEGSRAKRNRDGREGDNHSRQRSNSDGAYYLQLKDGKATKLVQWFTDEKVKPSTWPTSEVDLKAVSVNSVRGKNVAMVANVVRQTDNGFSELLFTSVAQSGPLGNVAVLKDVPHQEIRFISAHWDNFAKALKGPEASIGTKSSCFLLFMRNSLFISVMAVFGQILSSSFVAFGIARFNFKGRNTLFVILLATLMVPAQVTLIPLFSIYKSIGWIDSFLPLIVPQFTAGAFNVFLIRQFMLGMPKELDESAEIDGATALQVYGRIILPNCGPVLIIVGLFTFVASWQDVLGPLIYLDNPNYRTVSLGLEYFRSPYVDNRPLLMAGALLSMIPVACLFLIAQRYIMSGIATTGLK